MKLHYKTNNPHLNQRLTALVKLLELIFPERIRAYYLSGSIVSGTMVKNSDIDMIAVFKGEFAEGEADRLRAVCEHLTRLSDIRYDIAPRCEAQLQRNGTTGLKLAAELLYGHDIRDEIPLEPLAQFRHDALEGFVYYARALRDNSEPLAYPLSYPNPTDFYFGYTNNSLGDKANVAGTRLIINCVTLGATVRVLLATGERCTDKAQAVQRYGEFIGGRWGAWLAELFELCKLKWQYELPATPAEQAHLRTLLDQMVAYENEILAICRGILTAATDIPIIWKEENE